MQNNEYSLLSNSNNMENDSNENENIKYLQSSNNSTGYTDYNPCKRSKNELENTMNNLLNDINLSNFTNLSSSENVNPNFNPTIQIISNQIKISNNSEVNKKCIKDTKKNEEIKINENENKSSMINNYEELKRDIEFLKKEYSNLKKLFIDYIQNDKKKSNSEISNKPITDSNEMKKNKSIFSDLI